MVSFINGEPPRFSLYPNNLKCPEGTPAYWLMEVTGTYEIQWKVKRVFGGISVSAGKADGRYRRHYNGGTAEFIIISVEPADEGMFEFEFLNNYGTTSSTVKLFVQK